MSTGVRYAELQVTSHFSFLRGASSCEELFAQAKALGIEALGIVDRNSLAAIPRAHKIAKELELRLVVGCRLDLVQDVSVLVYPTNREAYGRLCRLLTFGKRDGKAGKCSLTWSDLVAYGEGLIVVLLPDETSEGLASHLRRIKADFADRAYVAMSLRRRPMMRCACMSFRRWQRAPVWRQSLPMTFFSMSPVAACYRMLLPAFAITAPSTMPAFAASDMRIAI